MRSSCATVVEAAEQAGRDAPRLVSTAYFAFGDREKAIENVVADYRFGGQGLVDATIGSLVTTPDAVRATMEANERAGASELFFWPQLDDPGEVEALAEAALGWRSVTRPPGSSHPALTGVLALLREPGDGLQRAALHLAT